MPSPDQPADEPILPHLVDAGVHFVAGNLFNVGESLVRAYQAIPTAADIYGESNVLVVDCLPTATTESEIEALVRPYAPPIKLKIPPDREGPTRAFVQFASFAEASKAAALNGNSPFGEPLVAFVVAQNIADREFPPQTPPSTAC